jgi:hypothetical protein
MLIDEIIVVEFKLSDIVSLPKVHRKFATFGKINDDKLVLTKSNLKDFLQNITDEDLKTYVQTWFAAGGSCLTIYNLREDLDFSAINIEEGNIILAGLEVAEQLAIYKSLSALQKKDKYFYVSYTTQDTLVDEFKGSRDIHAMLLDGQNAEPVFEYFAPYTKDGYYKQNNFMNSNLVGMRLESLNYLKENNLGALVHFPEFSQNKFFNIGDSAGYNYNINMLRKDLEIKAKEYMFNALQMDNTYNQNTISTLELQLAKAADYYADLGLIKAYETSSVALSKQDINDIKNGVVKGYTLKYKAVTEMKELAVGIQENI